jgi:hypothetical protein
VPSLPFVAPKTLQKSSRMRVSCSISLLALIAQGQRLLYGDGKIYSDLAGKFNPSPGYCSTEIDSKLTKNEENALCDQSNGKKHTITVALGGNRDS